MMRRELIISLVTFVALATVFAGSLIDKDCETPFGEAGQCKPLLSCSNLYEIFMNKSTSCENLKLLRESHCGFQDTTPLVCCPRPRPPRTGKAGGIKTVCTNPDNKAGSCGTHEECPALNDLSRTSKGRQFLRQSHCGMASGVPLVCCADEIETTEPPATTEKAPKTTTEPETTQPETTTVQTNLTANGPCKTPDSSNGICQPFRSCESLFSLPRNEETNNLLMLSLCFKQDGKTYVCCPIPAPESTTTESTTTTSTTTARTTTTTTASPENLACKDASGDDGICSLPKSCPHVADMLKRKPISPEDREFIQGSLCSSAGQKPLVCCAEQPEAEVWMQKLKKLLPPPPICGRFDVQDRIFGGTDTALDEYTWTVQLAYQEATEILFRCGGSLINERYTITAAHCATPLEPKFVRIGEWNTQDDKDCETEDDDDDLNDFCADPVIDNNVIKIIVHPNYRKVSKNKHNDIALLQMAKKVKFTQFVSPICLPLDPSLRTLNFTGHTFDVAGWGRTATSTKSIVKQKATLPFYPDEKCRQVFRSQGRDLQETQICVGGQAGRDTCGGDSGGPLMKYVTIGNMPAFVMVGIVSYGASECGKEGIPGVYTKVANYLPWIADNIK